MIKTGETHTGTLLLKQYVAGACVDLPNNYDFPAGTIIEINVTYQRILPDNEELFAEKSDRHV